MNMFLSKQVKNKINSIRELMFNVAVKTNLLIEESSVNSLGVVLYECLSWTDQVS